VHPAPPLRDVGCFAAVARWLSFSRAARELGLSQPAVSQAVARLEDALELRLFDRTSREVLLTDAGKLLLPYAEALLDQAAAFAKEAARLTEERGHPVRLAYCPLIGALAARAARRLARRSPPIELDLRPAGWAAATADLVSGSAGVAIMTTPFPLGFATTTRFHVPVTHLAVPADHPLATVSSVAPDQLVRRDLLAPRGLATQLPSGPGREVDDLAAALDLVAAGSGLLLAPNLLAQGVRRPDVRFVPLGSGTQEAGMRLTYGLVWRQDNRRPEVTALVQAVQEILRKPFH
jgi:DNA-binding transcriptional LysR family regulator